MEDMLPEMKEEPVAENERWPDKTYDDGGREELLTTRDGIVEIPIK